MSRDYSNLRKGLTLRYFWQVVSKYKLHLFVLISFNITAGILEIYIPFKFLKLWNVLNDNNFTLIGEAHDIIISVLILGLLRLVIARSANFINSYFQAGVMAGLRKQSFSYLIGHSHSFFANNFGGSLLQKVNKYVRSFEKLMDMFLDYGLPLIIRFVGMVIAVYTLSPKYSWMFLIFCVIFISTAFIYVRLKLKYDILSAEADTKTHGALADSISNHSAIQFFNGYDYEFEKVGTVVDKQRKINLINWYLWGGLSFIQSLYAVLAQFIIFWFAINDWGLGILNVPTMVLIQGYLASLTMSLWSFHGIIRTFYDSFADAQEMALILDTPYEIPEDNVNKTLNAVSGEIVFDNVTYIYDNNNQKVFDNFSLKIKAGEKVAIVGSSGAGKSTFVKLLMRLFNLTEGRILIDGVNISEISQKNLREQIGFVPQDPVLFHRTLMENIRYGNRRATDEQVKNAASLAHCDEFIKNLPNGFDTYVGERGVKLSGGERQRVAIARAILKNAPILILDEATSALDSESEMLIQDALHNLIKGKTVIVIAHRLSTIRNLDRIIVIDEGKIIEDGKHGDLIQKENGVYKKLWDIQAGGFQLTI